MRFNTNGNSDSSSSVNGISITAASTAADGIAKIAISANNIYAAGFGQYPGNLGVIVRYMLVAGAPLPVLLTSFNASLKNDNTVILNWQTQTQQGLSGFWIERANTVNNFLPIAFVPSAGNSNTIINYTANNISPLPGINYYRLKMPDIDAKYTFSNTIPILVESVKYTFNIAPNPVKDLLKVGTYGYNEQAAVIILVEGGKKLIETSFAFSNGSNK